MVLLQVAVLDERQQRDFLNSHRLLISTRQLIIADLGQELMHVKSL